MDSPKATRAHPRDEPVFISLIELSPLSPHPYNTLPLAVRSLPPAPHSLFMKRPLLLALSLSLTCAPFVSAAEPEVRRVPPPGVPVPDSVRAELTAAAADFAKQIAAL